MRLVSLVASFVCVLATADVCDTLAGDPPQPAPSTEKVPPPADFKQVIKLFGLRKDPLATADLVFHRGMAYQFIRAIPNEVMMIDLARQRVLLVDLKQKRQTEVTGRRLDAEVERLHRELADVVDRQEKQGGRAERLAGEIGHNVVDPGFVETFDKSNRTLRLVNPNVQVDIHLEPEPDVVRGRVILACMAAVARLTAIRDPEGFPPFVRLATTRALLRYTEYRPTEISTVLRLAGPPTKLRWTYEFVPQLTEREVEAIRRISAVRVDMPFVGLEEYEQGQGE